MLLLEIALTVAAWKKGWGARALVPMASGFGLAFLLGTAIGIGGGGQTGIGPFAIVLEILMIAALAQMSRTAPATMRTVDPVSAGGSAVPAQS